MSDVRTVVTLGTATLGGGFPVYGQAVADTVNEVDPSLDMKPQNTKGSTENVPMLEAGTLDLALVQGEVAHEAWTGIGRAPAALRLVAAMYSTAGMFVVRADSKVAHPGPGRPTRRLRSAGLGPHHSRPLRPRWPRPRPRP